MSRINNRSFARIAVSFSAAALVALGTALPSFADSATTTIGVLAGGLSTGTGSNATGFVDAATVHLNGSAQTPTIRLNFADVIDSTGTGAGWNLSMTMTQFNDGVGGHTIPAGSLTTRSTSIVSLLDPSSSPMTSVHPQGALTVRGTALDSLPTLTVVPLISADLAGGGMGSYNISPLDLALNVPAQTYIATYHSDAVVTLAVGP